MRAWVIGTTITVLLLTAGCGDDQGHDADPAQIDATAVPTAGVCRDLTIDDVRVPTNATRTVPCTEDHTAVTIATGTVPAGTDDVHAASLAAWAYRTCSQAFETYLGADESTAMRTLVGWAWFRPSDQAWDDGARWYRCDLIGGSQQASSLRTLPADAHDLLSGQPDDEWMACANGADVDTAPRLSCAKPHEWRAVTTIKLGEAGSPYPGDDVSERRTSQFCADSVAAWLGYPASYDYGYTWFGREAWAAGNRRAVCWARTSH